MKKKVNVNNGKKMMKIAAPFMIAAGVIQSFLGIAEAAAVANRNAEYLGEYPQLLVKAVLASCALLFVIGIVELLAGVFGTKGKKAALAMGLTITTVVLSLGYNVLSYTFNYLPDAMSIILGIILPCVYIAGAVMNKKRG